MAQIHCLSCLVNLAFGTRFPSRAGERVMKDVLSPSMFAKNGSTKCLSGHDILDQEFIVQAITECQRRAVK